MQIELDIMGLIRIELDGFGLNVNGMEVDVFKWHWMDLDRIKWIKWNRF